MSDTLATPSPLKFRWYFGVAGLLSLFVVIGAYSSRMAQDTSDYDHDRVAARLATLAKMRAQDEKTLTTADWIDKTKGVVRIPIDEAMPQTVAALQAKPVAMGSAIPGAVVTAKVNVIPASAANAAPAGSPQAAPSTNAAPNQPPAPNPAAPNH